MAFEPVTMGKTGLKIGRMGLASGYGIPQDAVEEAVERGVNYLYWGSFRRAGMRDAIRKIVKDDRGRVIIAIQVYNRILSMARRKFEKGLRDLRIEYADVLLLGWYNRRPSQRMIDYALSLKEQGKIKYLALSTHKRPLVPELAADKAFDIFHVRYNAGHRGAETDIFPKISSENGPGIVAYTATCWGQLLNPRMLPAGVKPPTATDCYRFVLSHLSVHCCMSGPKNLSNTRDALKALELGPMSPEELEWMRKVGNAVTKRAEPESCSC